MWIWVVVLQTFVGCSGLYPRPTPSRSTVVILDGLWDFRADDSRERNKGFTEQWFNQSLSKTGEVMPMPVPASFNDITQDKSLRDFVGWVWYDKHFYFPVEFQNRRLVLRIGSAHYNSIVWVNGKELFRHEGGHLPFEVEVKSALLSTEKPSRITVALNNTLSPTTLPPGSITYKHDTNRYPDGYFVQNLQMDFFNYAGIHRSVIIYSTPKLYIDDITLTTDIRGNDGIVKYLVVIKSGSTFIRDTGSTSLIQSVSVSIFDAEGNVVGKAASFQGNLTIHNARFWWPWTMNITSPAYLYDLQVTVISDSGERDVYHLPFGIRTVAVTSTQLLLNNRPFYCHGVAKHEDADIRGKGVDFPLIVKDFNLMKWLGVNCIRTSHYPYAEEFMDQCDRQGIVVIDESPGVGIRQRANFGNVSLAHHMKVMEEMVLRDKNRPSVIMWSIANEPDTTIPEAVPYFKPLILLTKSLDTTRPVTFVANADFTNDLVAQYVDVLCVNRYYAWYSDCSHTELIQRQLNFDLQGWHTKFNKPVILTEYGSDTVPGLHQSPSFVFTEEFQVDFMSEYHQVFDSLKEKFLVGEMVWNFADFMTKQDITRVVGNRKGVFTRQRQPKMAAHLLRYRYHKLMNSSAVTISDSLRYAINAGYNTELYTEG